MNSLELKYYPKAKGEILDEISDLGHSDSLKSK
jgi:hypothetical protein